MQPTLKCPMVGQACIHDECLFYQPLVFGNTQQNACILAHAWLRSLDKEGLVLVNQLSSDKQSRISKLLATFRLKGS